MGPVVEIVNCVENFLQTKNPTCHGESAQKKSVVMEASIMTLVSSELFATLTDGVPQSAKAIESQFVRCSNS